MNEVSLVRCESYEPGEVDRAVRRSVDLVGGMGRFVSPGDRVLLKPNMLAARAPEKRVTTDPEVVKAAARLVLEAGGRPFVGDSPGIESFARVAEKTGIAGAARTLGIECAELASPVPVELPAGAVFRRLEIASRAVDADVVINLPKLKTHGQMLLTLGVKNLFGTIVAQRKAEWHHMAGVDRDTFASLLLDIHAAVDPSLTILDGVWGMEGRGPSNGTPRKLDLIAAAPDAVALDMTVCRMLGIPLRSYSLYRAARARGMAGAEPGAVRVKGEPLESFAVSDFSIPSLDSLHMLPGTFEWFTRRYLVSKPVHRGEACIGCGRCREICPADAVTCEGTRVEFDYDRCIRCYCCQEICPEDAIGFRKGLLLRVLQAFGR